MVAMTGPNAGLGARAKVLAARTTRLPGRARRLAGQARSELVRRLELARIRSRISPDWRLEALAAPTSTLLLTLSGDSALPLPHLAIRGADGATSPVQSRRVGHVHHLQTVVAEVVPPEGTTSFVLECAATDGRRRVVPSPAYEARERGALASIEVASDGTRWHVEPSTGRVTREPSRRTPPLVRRVRVGVADVHVDLVAGAGPVTVEIVSRRSGSPLATFASPAGDVLTIRLEDLLPSLADLDAEREERADVLVVGSDGARTPLRLEPSDLVDASRVVRYSGLQCWLPDRACAVWPYWTRDQGLALKIVAGPIAA